MAATVLHLPTLVDLAVGKPEAVQHDMLHSILQVMVQQLDLDKVKVEFRGDDSEKVQNLLGSIREENRSHLEYKVHLDDLEKVSRDESSIKNDLEEKKSKESEIIYVVEAGNVVDLEKRKPQTVSYSSFARLEGKVKVLQAQIDAIGSHSIPDDEKLLEETRKTPDKPISNLITSMNITKRMSGAEEGIDKLASLLETVAKEYSDLKILLDKVEDELGMDVVETMKEIKLAADYARKMRPRANLYEKILTRKIPAHYVGPAMVKTSLEDLDEDGEEEDGSKVDTVNEFENEELTPAAYTQVIELVPEEGEESEKLNALICQHEFLRRNVEYVTAQVNTLADFAEQILPEILAGLPHMEDLKKKIAEIRGKTGSDATITEEEWAERRRQLTVEERVTDLESRLSSHASKLRRQDALFCDKYDQVLLSLRTMEEFIAQIKQRLHMDQGDSVHQADDVMDPEYIRLMDSKIDSILTEINDLRYQITDVLDAQKKADEIFEQVYTEIESLQLSKADRFEMDDILADKADCKDVQQKVDQDLFEEFCNNLSKGVDSAIQKTEQQDKHWRKELAKMFKIVQTKFNTNEVPPLRCELVEMIEKLKERVEEVAAMKAYAMAAGTKKRLFTEVNCISCDKKAAMDINEVHPPVSKDVSAYVNVRPYIAYELDQLRNMQIKNPGAKNVILQEEIMKNYAKNAGFNVSSKEDVRFVNRYCGGSETLLNPQQKIPKSGNTTPL